MMHVPFAAAPSGRSGDATSMLDALRRRGVQVWALIGWLALAALLLANATIGAGVGGPLLLIGCATNIGPTVMALRGRHDAAARSQIGALAAVIPAMLVFLLRGHPWQMDAHMYFFVGMAALVVLADWRPLVVATVLTAAHHVLLEWLAPAWVFTGSGNIGRIVFHVAAVGLQFLVLALLTIRLERLVDAQDASVATSQALAEAAEEGRLRTLEAMEQARLAEARGAGERRAHEGAAAREAVARRGEFIALADKFERSVSSVVHAIGGATGRLEVASERLDATVAGTDRVAEEVAAGAGHAAGEIAQVASSIRELSLSIETISGTARRQIDLARQASGEARRSVETIATLEERTALIEGLVDDIRKIAGKTNLLALNATIEAARAGEAGRGFAVVAGEVKTLAADSARASNRISELLAGIRQGVLEASTNLRGVNHAIGDVASAADGIATAVGEHQQTARSVGMGSDRAVETSASVGRRVAGVAAVSGIVTTLTGDVRDSAGELTGSARDLRASADLFLSFLRGHQSPAA